MNDEQYREHCNGLMAEFARDLHLRTENLPPEDPLRELAQAFADLAGAPREAYSLGPALVARLFTTYPEMAPLLPRQLLWFLGGDCLHYMPDEEIEVFQRLEDMRREAAARGDVLDLQRARAKLLNLQ